MGYAAGFSAGYGVVVNGFNVGFNSMEKAKERKDREEALIAEQTAKHNKLAKEQNKYFTEHLTSSIDKIEQYRQKIDSASSVEAMNSAIKSYNNYLTASSNMLGSNISSEQQKEVFNNTFSNYKTMPEMRKISLPKPNGAEKDFVVPRDMAIDIIKNRNAYGVAEDGTPYKKEIGDDGKPTGKIIPLDLHKANFAEKKNIPVINPKTQEIVYVPVKEANDLVGKGNLYLSDWIRLFEGKGKDKDKILEAIGNLTARYSAVKTKMQNEEQAGNDTSALQAQLNELKAKANTLDNKNNLPTGSVFKFVQKNAVTKTASPVSEKINKNPELAVQTIVHSDKPNYKTLNSGINAWLAKDGGEEKFTYYFNSLSEPEKMKLVASGNSYASDLYMKPHFSKMEDLFSLDAEEAANIKEGAQYPYQEMSRMIKDIMSSDMPSDVQRELIKKAKERYNRLSELHMQNSDNHTGLLGKLYEDLMGALSVTGLAKDKKGTFKDTQEALASTTKFLVERSALGEKVKGFIIDKDITNDYYSKDLTMNMTIPFLKKSYQDMTGKEIDDKSLLLMIDKGMNRKKGNLDLISGVEEGYPRPGSMLDKVIKFAFKKKK